MLFRIEKATFKIIHFYANRVAKVWVVPTTKARICQRRDDSAKEAVGIGAIAALPLQKTTFLFWNVAISTA
ncbi:MAG: hypothetical protein KME11_22485 [Timaviella obliquedivisa GSE-PSE-MK23-08B]|jgi:hypothetical protein|nr:hypothetical protein [Timaviella obliquedivisa GSE-PSE-MK23-08B]